MIMNKELYNLLTDLKELAMNRVPINILSLMNTFEDLGFKIEYQNTRNNKFFIDVYDDTGEYIYAIMLYKFNETDGDIKLCNFSYNKEFNYSVDHPEIFSDDDE